MKTTSEDVKIVPAKNQLRLFGFKNYFNSFIKLYEKKKMPNSILLSGSKGLGKSTFAYHIINYLLSKNEERKYSIENFAIDETNLSYRLLNTYTHPNFFLIENNLLERDIKIEQVRNLLKFLSKSTYTRNLKIIMIDNAENLNLNSANALLKALEEVQNNTFFFIIHNSASKILDTIRSRCTEFKFFFTISEKKTIFESIIKQYKNEFKLNQLVENLYYDTPGNLIKYFLTLDDANINLTGDKLPCILYFIEKYKNEKNLETLTFLCFFICKFYNDLCLCNNNKVSSYLYNLSKILKQIDDMKKFNLNEKNILIWIKDILSHEAK
ncbi:MAG TPA: AAA family ATPase [Pelagibacteraceae bacterium]|jgi:DNA polymerase-3 subunit delta'|nr:AAA family ATPase [Pelagibacteraceae bacterium]|tara:strand:+ start:5691 stop:6665 length:975 start_codon:yes stop_codon:yes gene_type:complete